MLNSSNSLIICYEGKQNKISIPKSLKELDESFLKKYQISDNFPHYFYYELQPNLNIILNEESFYDFLDSEINILYANKINNNNKKDIFNNMKNDTFCYSILKEELEKEILRYNNYKKRRKFKDLKIITNVIILEYKGNKNFNNEKYLIEAFKNKNIELLNKIKKLNERENKNIDDIKNDFSENNKAEERQKIYEELKTLKKENLCLKNQIKNLETKLKESIDILNERNNNENLLKKKIENIVNKFDNLKKELSSKSQKNQRLNVYNNFNINLFPCINRITDNSTNKEASNNIINDKSEIDNKENKKEIHIKKLNKLYTKKNQNNNIKKINNNNLEKNNLIDIIKKEEEQYKKEYKRKYYKINQFRKSFNLYEKDYPDDILINTLKNNGKDMAKSFASLFN